MRYFLTGAIAMALLCSVALNIMQYNGTLGSPQAFRVVSGDEARLAAVLEP